MPEHASRSLRVFLCHSSGDKPTVRELYQKLSGEGWIDVWLDEEELLPGQDWNREIETALDNSDAVIVTLSSGSISKEGYVQKELRFALDIALEKPEGTIFILPVRLDDCERPRRLKPIQGVDYFPLEQRSRAYFNLLRSLELRAKALGLVASTVQLKSAVEQPSTKPAHTAVETDQPLSKSNSGEQFRGRVKIQMSSYDTRSLYKLSVLIDDKKIPDPGPEYRRPKFRRFSDIKDWQPEIFNELLNPGHHTIVVKWHVFDDKRPFAPDPSAFTTFEVSGTQTTIITIRRNLNDWQIQVDYKPANS